MPLNRAMAETFRTSLIAEPHTAPPENDDRRNLGSILEPPPIVPDRQMAAIVLSHVSVPQPSIDLTPIGESLQRGSDENCCSPRRVRIWVGDRHLSSRESITAASSIAGGAIVFHSRFAGGTGRRTAASHSASGSWGGSHPSPVSANFWRPSKQQRSRNSVETAAGPCRNNRA